MGKPLQKFRHPRNQTEKRCDHAKLQRPVDMFIGFREFRRVAEMLPRVESRARLLFGAITGGVIVPNATSICTTEFNGNACIH